MASVLGKLWNGYAGAINKGAAEILRTFNNFTFKVEKNGAGYFYSANYDAWNELDYLASFFEVPELNAVITMKARMFSNGLIKEVDANGTEVLNSKLVAVLRNPNWFQAEKEFLRQTKIFREIFGNEYLYEVMPFGVAIENATNRALYTLPSSWVDVKYGSAQPFFREVDGSQYVTYTVKYNGDEYVLVSEGVTHLNDDRVELNNYQYGSMFSKKGSSFLKGESKLRALTPAINNIKMAYETRGTILRNRGALGLLSNATSDKVGMIPLDPEERDRVQRAYNKNYGGLKGQFQLLITGADLRWQQMGVNPDRLGLFDETREDFNKIIDSYGMKSDLFVRQIGSTFENQKQAEKSAYVNTIIPEANEWIGAFNRKYRNGAKTSLIMDYLHLPIFQEDLKARGESLGATVNALSKALTDGAITLEQYQTELQKYGFKF